LDPALPLVAVDRISIEQVIGNLVRNAVDAMQTQESARTLWIETRLAPNAVPGAMALEVSVRDSGPGLQGRTIDTLCSTFYSTKANGMGLGLGICRAIVESHGGKLHAQDAAGGGAEMRFTLPVPQDIQPEEQP
jgi:C4-dicarboxylate-specific signal transduction histidine kinase